MCVVLLLVEHGHLMHGGGVILGVVEVELHHMGVCWREHIVVFNLRS